MSEDRGTRQREVLHLSSVHRAGDTRILWRECETLADDGRYKVTLVANADESLAGVNTATSVVELHPPRRRPKRLWRVLQVLKFAWRSDASIVHVHDPELVLVAALLRVGRRVVIIDVHEEIAAQFRTKSRYGRLQSRLAAMAGRVIERAIPWVADFVVVADPLNARHYPGASVVANHALASEFERQMSGDRNNLIYVGGISRARGLERMLGLAEALGSRGLGRLKLAGPFQPPSLLEAARGHPGWNCVDYLGLLSREQVVAELSKASVGLALLDDTPNYRNALPTKVFEYLFAGLRVVASDLPSWRSTFAGAPGVDLVDPYDEQACLNAVLNALDEVQDEERQGIRRFARDRWAWEAGPAQELLAVYSRASDLAKARVRPTA